MKSLLSLLILLLTATIASAQLPVGSWYTGACIKFDYSTTNDGDTKSTDFLFYPATYYTLNDHWGVGGGLWFESMTTKTGSDQKSTTTTYGIDPGVRYYGKITERVNCYFQGNLDIGAGTTKYEFDGDETKTNNFSVGLEAHPGIMWNIKERTYIDFSYGSFSYLHTTYKDESDNKTSDNSFLLNLNMWSLGVGLFYTFGNTE